MPYAMSRFSIQCVAMFLSGSLALLQPDTATAWAIRPLTVMTLGIRPHRPGHSEQQQVLRVEDEVRRALLAADSGTLDRLLADDFLGISANGTLSDKQQYLRRIGKKEHQFSRIDVTDSKIRVQPNSAIVVSTAEVTGKLDTSPINGTYRYTRVYSREQDGSWKLRNFEATRVSGAAQDEMRHGVPVRKTK